MKNNIFLNTFEFEFWKIFCSFINTFHTAKIVMLCKKQRTR